MDGLGIPPLLYLVERRQPRPLPLQLRLRFQGGEDEQDCPEARGGEGD